MKMKTKIYDIWIMATTRKQLPNDFYEGTNIYKSIADENY